MSICRMSIYQGYRGRRAYIATQMPLSHTVNDFWHLVYDHGPAAIILLHNCEDSETEEEVRYYVLQVWHDMANYLLK